MNQEQTSASSPKEERLGIQKPSQSPLSLSRLREAFVVMLGARGGEQQEASSQGAAAQYGVKAEQLPAVSEPEISPRSVVEAMLFVGQPDNRPISAREMAAAMRGVSPAEIASEVTALNATYTEDNTPYTIECTSAGYRTVLRPQFDRMRDKFFGRVREAKLSPTALEVLSIVAYNEPATLTQINEIRGAPSGAILSTLVRRRLLRLDRPSEKGQPTCYATTDRFLRLFGLETLSALPRSEDLEKL